MRQPSNVRCYLPKHEAAKLLSVIEQIAQVMGEIDKQRREHTDKEGKC